MRRFADMVAWILLGLTTSLWTFWSVSELYYEGWGLPFPQPLAYLVPAGGCLLFVLVSLRWQRLGGWIVLVGGALFTAWWWSLAYRRGNLTAVGVLAMFPVSGLILLEGALLILGARARETTRGRLRGVWRHWRALITVGAPVLVVLAVSAYNLPVVLTRLDDGFRGARTIEGNGVTLVWAPAGPGWNWKQPWGGYPSWASIARYGAPPVGLKTGEELGELPVTQAEMDATSLCAYLSADGLRLLDEPQHIWRMPTVAELVRSLTRDGQNAGCVPPKGEGRADCTPTPDKETPLWAPDQPPIYYWAAEEASAEEAWYVSYNGSVRKQPKTWGNPRHGYRCVRDPN